MPVRCPNCGGNNAQSASSEERRRLGVFQAVSPLKCSRCAYVWEPSAPRWFLVVGILAGLSMLACLVWLTAWGGYRSILGIAFLGGAGSTTVIGCLRRLASARGEAGQNRVNRAEDIDQSL